MKFSLFLGVLLFSASPAFTDELLYLKCPAKIELKSLEGDTRKILEEKTEFYTFAYKVNFDKRQLTSSGNKLTMDFSLNNGEITVIKDSTSQKQMRNELLKIRINPPFARSSTLSLFDYERSINYKFNSIGECTKVDASEFEKFFKQ